MNKFFIYFLIMLSIVLHSLALADQADFDHHFEQGLQAAKDHTQAANDVFHQFNAENTFKNYTSTPEQSHYYSDVTQDKTTLKQDAIEKSVQSDVGKAVKAVDENKQQIDKIALAHETDRISKLQDQANEIVKGITNQFADCTKQQSCTTEYEEKLCEEVPESQLQICNKTLSIDMISHQADTHYILTARLSVNKWHNYAAVVMNAVNGNNNELHPNGASASLNGRLPSTVDCHTLQGKILSESGDAHLDSIEYPSCNNGSVFNIRMSGGHNKELKIDLISSKTTYEPQDNWKDDCLGLAANNSCTLQSEQCVQPSETRNTVARDCWEKELSYVCHASSLVSTGLTCDSLRNQSCEQISSVCKEKTDAGCALFARSYRCPTRECKATGIICNGQTYCLDGDCLKHQKQADPDFQKAVAALSASMDAAKKYDAGARSLFAGTLKTCRNFMLGAAYCCKDEGWLVENNLLACNEEEKELGHAKENGTAHYVGRMTKGCVGDVCLKKVKSYCIFPSKLARIVQEEGRQKQLGRQFGSAENPDCSGISIEELQKIDFSRIDFKEFYDDIAQKQHIEDRDVLNKRIQDHMQHLIDDKRAHDDLQK